MARGAAARVLPVALILAVPAAALLTGAAFTDVALNALLGLAVVAACGLGGGPPLRWLRLPALAAVDQGVIAVTLGTVVIGLLLLALGAVGLLRSWTVLAVVGTAAGLGAWYAPPWMRIRAAWRGAAVLFDGFGGALLVLGLFLCVTLLLAVSAVPVWDWDSMMYHLPVPAQWLDEGRIFLPQDNMHAAYAGLVHMLYLVPLALGRPAGAAVVSGLLALLLALALARVVAHESDEATGRLAVAGLAGTSVILFVAVTPRVDVSLALFLFLAHWAVLQASAGRTPRWLLAAAGFGGAAFATKLHAGAYLIPLTLWVIWLLVRGRVPVRACLSAAALAVAIVAPWLLKNYLIVGNPLHPMLAPAAFPPWLMEEAGVAAAAGGVDTDLVWSARAAVNLRDLFLAPDRLSPEPDAAFYVWSPLVVVGVFFVLTKPGTWRWALPAAGYLLILLLRSDRTNLRYLIPALPGLSAAAALALSGAMRRRDSRRTLINALLALSLLPLAVPLRQVARWARHPEQGWRYDTIYAAAREASRQVPGDGVILMLYEARGWPFDRVVLQDNLTLTWPLLVESGHAETCLGRLDTRITHVLLNSAALDFYQRRGGSAQHVRDGALDRFIERCLEDEVVVGWHRLYRVGGAGPSTDRSTGASSERTESPDSSRRGSGPRGHS